MTETPMTAYIGTKRILAVPMSRGDYNLYRGWDLPVDENADDEGFLVEYLDSDSNHSNHEGYVSWSPKKQFTDAYQPLTNMSFSHALILLKQGFLVQRSGWNGKGMWLIRVIPTMGESNDDRVPNDLLPWIGMKTADDKFVPWLASQTDMLSDDWQVVF